MYRAILPVLLAAPACLALPGTPKYPRAFGDTSLQLPPDMVTDWYEAHDTPSNKTAGPSDPDSVYNCVGPDVKDYPKKGEWLPFETLWKINEPLIKEKNKGKDYAPFIRKAIEDVSSKSKVDARLILAIIMQEVSYRHRWYACLCPC
jgi:hypothetical protein